MKTLREYEHIAQKDHWCDICCQYIVPGEMYRGSVCINEKSKYRLIVWKHHINPSCDYPPDHDDDRERDSKDKDLRDKVKQEGGWLKAA